MSSPVKVLKIVVSYLVFGVIGTILAAGAASAFQIWTIKKVIASANVIQKDPSTDAMLSRLIQTEYWASRYPVLTKQLNMAVIRCQVKRQDMRSATNTAWKIYDGRFDKARPSLNLFEVVQNVPNSLINGLMEDGHLTRYSGYEELVNAVRQSGNYSRLVEISKLIITIDPNSALAKTVRGYIPVESVAAQPSVVTNKVEGVQPAQTDHKKLLATYLSQRDWDKVLVECNTLLETAPGDPSLLETKRLAEVKGKRWGVVNAVNAPSYTTTGKFVKTMPSGYVLDIVDIIKASREELALCSVIIGTSSETNFLIRTRDMAVHLGDFRKLSEDGQKLFSKQFDLSVRMTALRSKLIATAVDTQNPYSAEYKAAKQAHETYWAKVRDLQKQRDSSATSYEDRIRIGEDLRKMKGEDIRLGMALEAAKKKYDEASSKNSMNIQSPELVSLEKELAEVRERIRTFE